MDLLALSASLTIMATIVTAMVAVYQSSQGARAQLDRRLDHLLTNEAGFQAAIADYQSLRTRRIGRVPILGSLLEGKAWTDEIALRLERADMRLTVSEFVALRVLFALFLGIVPFFLFGGLLGTLLMLVFAGIGYMLPSFYVSFATGRRLKKLNNQLPETLTLLSNSLKAGFGIMQSMELASRELPHPISTELRRTLHDLNVGASTDEALQNLVKRNESDDLDIVVTAMIIQQSTGGNLSEILDNVNHTMRERIRIRGEIKTLTSQQMLTGMVIGALPFFVGVLFQLMNPAYMAPLFSEPLGNVMLVAAGVMELFGILLIKRILNIEV